MSTIARTVWREALVAALACLVVWVGLAAQGADRLFGVVSGVAVLASVVVSRRSRLVGGLLLVLGVLPLAVLTWWSIVTPVLAILCLALGWPRRRLLEPGPVGASSGTTV